MKANAVLAPVASQKLNSLRLRRFRALRSEPPEPLEPVEDVRPSAALSVEV